MSPSKILGPNEDVLEINKDTKVRIGAVMAVASFLFYAAWTSYTWLDTRFKAVERNMEESTRRIEAASSDRWTRTDQRLLLLELQIRNPKLVVPAVPEGRR